MTRLARGPRGLLQTAFLGGLRFAHGPAKLLLSGFAIAGAATGAQLVLHVLLGRQLGPVQYGALSVALGLATLLALFPGLGVQIAVTRLLPQFRLDGQVDLMAGVVLWSGSMALTLGILLGVACTLAGNLVADPVTASVMWCAGLLTPLIALRVLLRRQLMGLGRERTGMFLDDGATATIMLFAMLPMAALEMPFRHASAALLVFATACAVVVLVEAGCVWRSVPGGLFAAIPRIRPVAWTVVGLPLLVAMLGRTVLNRVDVVVVAPVAGMAAVGQFAAAWRLAYLLMFVPLVTSTLYSSRMATAYHAGRHLEVRQLYWLSCGVSTAVAAPLLLALTVFSDETVQLVYGDEYAPATPILTLLAIGNGVFALTGGLPTLLAMTGRERGFGLSSIAVAGLAIAAMVPLTGWFGAVGAAAGYLGAMVVLQGWQIIIARDLLLPPVR